MRKHGYLCILMLIIVMMPCSKTEAKEWRTDFKNAATAAKASGKYILLDFSGSDWCVWCKRLEKEVFSQDAFKKFAEDNLVCVLIDFPSAKEQPKELKQQNMDLVRKYDIKGYPTVIILSPDGKLVGKTGYMQGGPWEYARHLKKIIDEYKSRL